MADYRKQLHAVICRGIRSGLCKQEHKTLEDLVNDGDDKHFGILPTYYTTKNMTYTPYSLVLLKANNLRLLRCHNLIFTIKNSSIA